MNGYAPEPSAENFPLGDLLMVLATALSPKLAPAAYAAMGMRNYRAEQAAAKRKQKAGEALTSDIFRPRDVIGETGLKPWEREEEIETPRPGPGQVPRYRYHGGEVQEEDLFPAVGEQELPSPAEQRWQEQNRWGEQQVIQQTREAEDRGGTFQPPVGTPPLRPGSPLAPPPPPLPPTFRSKKYTLGTTPSQQGKVGEAPSEIGDWIQRLGQTGIPGAVAHHLPGLVSVSGAMQRGEQVTPTEMDRAMKAAGYGPDQIARIFRDPEAAAHVAGIMAGTGRWREALALMKIQASLPEPDQTANQQAFVESLYRSTLQTYEKLPPAIQQNPAVQQELARSKAMVDLARTNPREAFKMASGVESKFGGAASQAGEQAERATLRREQLSEAKTRLALMVKNVDSNIRNRDLDNARAAAEELNRLAHQYRLQANAALTASDIDLYQTLSRMYADEYARKVKEIDHGTPRVPPTSPAPGMTPPPSSPPAPGAAGTPAERVRRKLFGPSPRTP